MLTFPRRMQPKGKSIRILMKSLKFLTLIICLLGAFQTSEAQILKKLKKKVTKSAEETIERKAEDKAAETTEKTIDGIFKKRKKKKKKSKKNEQTQEEATQDKSYGSATLTGPNHGPVEIFQVAQPKVEVNAGAGTTRISAWWNTHGTDTYDMFDLTVNQVIDENTSFPLSINVPGNGELKIYYDALLGAYLPAEEWQRSKDPNFELVHNNPPINGTVTLKVVDQNQIAFEFSGGGFSGTIAVSEPLWSQVKEQKQASSRPKERPAEPTMELKDGDPGIYDFNYEIATVVTSTDGEEYPISYLINDQTNYFGMMVDMSQIEDGEVEGSSVIVMQKGQTRVFVDTPMMKVQMNQDMSGQSKNPVPDMDQYNFSKPVKTGQTRVIAGYTCDEYVLKHEQGTLTFWAAPELQIPNWMFGSQSAVEQTGVLGFVLAFSSTDSSGTTKSEVKYINDKFSKRIDASEYKKMF